MQYLTLINPCATYELEAFFVHLRRINKQLNHQEVSLLFVIL
jgi:hypothetical protein